MAPKLIRNANSTSKQDTIRAKQSASSIGRPTPIINKQIRKTSSVEDLGRRETSHKLLKTAETLIENSRASGTRKRYKSTSNAGVVKGKLISSQDL